MIGDECEMNSLIADRNLPDIQLKEKLFSSQGLIEQKGKGKELF